MANLSFLKRKPKYQGDILGDTEANLSKINFAMDCNNFANAVCQEHNGDIAEALGGDKNLAMQVWKDLTPQARNKISNFNKRSFQVFFAMLMFYFSSCKLIDTAHRDLEYREAQSYLEWQRSDEQKPATLPYWKVDLEKTLTVQKGGQEK